ncbi:hypothetical protein F5148DRAFT_256403 [Russula earlei]|uniref:Uncharacterized protein n=1 Tax=Russula earlei TaxID=71964 RepID=A0ACC0U4M2_9AGAM|nr:hypothetical protein F5148DRAFT_256403 [Russula earlei]
MCGLYFHALAAGTSIAMGMLAYLFMDSNGSGTVHKVIAQTTCGGTRHRADRDRSSYVQLWVPFLCSCMACRLLDPAHAHPDPDTRAQLAARWAWRIDRPARILRRLARLGCGWRQTALVVYDPILDERGLHSSFLL